MLTLIRAAAKTPQAIVDWWHEPSAAQKAKASAEIAENQRARELRQQEKFSRVPPEAHEAYRKAMKSWRRTSPGSPQREESIAWLRIAARGGHPDAQMMAKMHQIDF